MKSTMSFVFSRQELNSGSHSSAMKQTNWLIKWHDRIAPTKRRLIIPFVIVLVIFSLGFNSMMNLNIANGDYRNENRIITIDSLNSNEKSHFQVCRAILGRDQPFMENGEKKNINVEIAIQESIQVCMDPNHVTESLIQIFTSSYLAYQGSVHGVNIKYGHNCRVDLDQGKNIYDELNEVTLQQALPRDFAIPEDDEHLSWELLSNLCENILKDNSINSISSAAKAFFSFDIEPSTNMNENLTIEKVLSNQESWKNEIISNNRKTIMEHAISFIQLNIKKSLDDLRINEYISDRKKGFIHTSINKLFSNDLQQNDSGSYTYQFNQQKNTASIYIPCYDSFCNDVLLLPYYIYSSHIPSSVQYLSVVIQKGCLTKNPNCMDHGKDLVQFLQEMFPMMQIELLAHNPSSPELMQLLLESEYVLCTPGYGEVCLFPSITRIFPLLERRKPPVSRIMTFEQNSNLHSQDDTAMKIDAASLPPSVNYLSYKLPDQLYTIPFPEFYSFLSSLPNDGYMFSTLRVPPPTATGDCRHIRGRVGIWQRDLNYAAIAQYDKPIRHYSGQTDIHYRRAYKRGEIDLEFRPSTTFKWEDTAVAHSTNPHVHSCDVQLMTLDKLCSTFHTLDVRRIFFLGDSLTLQHTQSMWKLLGQPHGPTKPKSLEPNFKHQIDCPNLTASNGEPFFFIFEFVRNDELLQNEKEVSMQNGIENCNQFCYPWEEKYKMHPNMRNLLIVNSGAHFKNTDQFEKALDGFVAKINEMLMTKSDGKRGDIIMFRTSVPGHRKCDRSGLLPFVHFGEYQDSISGENVLEDKYGWDKFFEYNSYATRLFDSHRHYNLKEVSVLGQSKPSHFFEILDVLPMTILRPDGHVGDEFKPDNIPTRDCLHYALPGPLDWWNHLLLSNLIDIANSEINARSDNSVY